VFIVGLLSPGRLLRGKTAEERELAARLQRGVRGNVVVEMGLALYRMARLLDRSEFEDLDRLAERIEGRRLSLEFLAAWDDFQGRFGCRGPQEMDLASPRYADDPRLALRQMSFMASDDAFDPGAAHERLVEEREAAFEALLRRSGPLRRALLRRVYRLNELFAGTRDTPKHLIVLANYALRRQALRRGQALVREGRLDVAEHVFDLSFDDLGAASVDPTLDLRAVREERGSFRWKLETHVRAFPAVIDSRGRVLRPPPKEISPGLLRGVPISPGVVTGPARVLRRADEKPVEKGDVLVAYTTDPGWTPLFVNAAAIVLEVGGVLQHGAVVAREYGKPCVAGIDQAVTRLRDGDLVEVDGAAGTVRRLS
jgi:rifampicin phosphotransferase